MTDKNQIQNTQMRRVNRLATLTGMVTVFLFIVLVFTLYFFPALYAPPPPTPLNTKLPTWTPRPTLTPTRTATPTPPPTSTPAPRVELLSANYLPAASGCQVEVIVRVNGDSVIGVFHLWNTASQDPAGTLGEPETLLSGETGGHLFDLSSNQPALSTSEIWFEYDGIQSNRLVGLVCPELTPTP